MDSKKSLFSEAIRRHEIRKKFDEQEELREQQKKAAERAEYEMQQQQ